MANAPDTLVVTGPAYRQVPIGDSLVTPTGGDQISLADALAGPSGAVEATTLSASSTVTLSPDDADVTMSPTGTGTVVIDPATAGAMDNIAIGGTTAAEGSFTVLNGGTVTIGTGTPVKGLLVSSATLSPGTVAANTTAEQLFAVAGVLATDVVMAINKPTEQAGLGIAGQRVSAAGTIGITFVNATASPIVPTAAEAYKVVTLSH